MKSSYIEDVLRHREVAMNKQYILDEIARTAASNGGVALGKERFLKETGIRESDWSGKFWARWSEAVNEAGCTPSKLNAPMEEVALLESLVALIRELGHWPVESERKLKAKQTTGFPSHNTFGKFGNKSQQLQKVIEYCEGKPYYADVLAIAKAAAPEEVSMTEDEASLEEKAGFIYLLKAGRMFKIGRTNSLERRSRELAIQLPEKADRIHEIKTDDTIGIERYWHDRFKTKRKNGEWFELTGADVKAFKRRKFM